MPNNVQRRFGMVDWRWAHGKVGERTRQSYTAIFKVFITLPNIDVDHSP